LEKRLCSGRHATSFTLCDASHVVYLLLSELELGAASVSASCRR